MADLNQLYDALLKADAAGDVEGARTLAQYIQQARSGMPQAAPTAAPPKEDTGFFDMAGRAIVRGAKQTGSLLGDVLPAMAARAVGADEYAARQMAEAAETQKEIEAKYGARYKELSDVKGLGDVLPFVAETVLEQVPNLAAAVIPGAGGAMVGGRLAAQQAAKTLAAREATQAGSKYAAMKTAQGAAYGGGAGAFLGSYAMNAPEVFQNIYETTKDEATGEGQMALGASLVAGSVSAALDSILPAYLVRQFTPGMKAGVVEKLLERSGMAPGVARGATAGLITGAATEAPTEAAQEAISIAAEKFVDEHSDVWNSKDFNRVVESFVRGGVGGGGISSVAGGVKGYLDKRAETVAFSQGKPGASALDQLDSGQVEGEEPPPQFRQQAPMFTPDELAATKTGEGQQVTPAASDENLAQAKDLRAKVAEIDREIRKLEQAGTDETIMSEWYAERDRLSAQERALRRGEAPAPTATPQAPTIPRVQVGPNPNSFVNLNSQQNRDIADQRGLTQKIESEFATGKTARQVRDALDKDLSFIPAEEREDFIVQVRATLGIPSRATAEGKAEFDAWKKEYDVRQTPSDILRAPSAREKALRMAGVSEEEIQRRKVEFGEPGATYKVTPDESRLKATNLVDAGIYGSEAESIVNEIKKGRVSGKSKSILSKVASGMVQFPDGWRVPTEQDYAQANEFTRGRFDRAKQVGAQASQQTLLAQQMGLDLAPAEEGVSREFVSPIAMSEQEFALTAPEGQVPSAVDIDTEVAPAAVPLNLVEKDTQQIETMLNNLKPTVQAEQGVKNYKAAISNFLDEIKQYLVGMTPERRRENLNLINDFFNSLGFTSEPKLAQSLVSDLQGKSSSQQSQIIAERTRMPDITTPAGLSELRDRFQDFMEQQSLGRIGEFPGRAATATFASDIYIPAQVASILRQLRSRSPKSLSPEERAFMAYMSRFKYGLAMKSAAYDLANDVPMGDMFSGQGAKSAALFQKFVEENFPAQIFTAFNETISEYQQGRKRSAHAAAIIKTRQDQRKAYMQQLAKETAEAETEMKRQAKLEADRRKKESLSQQIQRAAFSRPEAYFKPIHPAIEQKLADGDLDGALELIERFPAAKYWQLLARRMRALDLNTTTQVGEQERLLRFDLAKIAPSVNQLIENIRDLYPQVYEAHIAPALNEANEIDIKAFAKGLKAIKDGALLGEDIVNSSQVVWISERYADAAKSLDAPGFYMLRDDIINLNPAEGGNSYYALFHELAHAATAHAIRNPEKLNTAQREALNNLEKLYEYTVANHPAVYEYGFQSLDEFIAEAFSNAEFQALLSRIPYKNTESSLWSRFIDYVRKLLGGKDTVLFGTLANADVLMTASEARAAGSNKYGGTLMASAPRAKRTTAGTFKTSPDMDLNRRWINVLSNRPTWQKSKGGVAQMLENVSDATRKHFLGAFTLRQLQDLIGGRLGDSAQNFIGAVEDMLEDRNTILEKVGKIEKKWGAFQSKNPQKGKDLSLLMIDTTLAGIDPDRQPSKDAELTRRWNDLGSEGQAIYREVRDFYKERLNEYRNTFARNIELSMIAKGKTPAEIKVAKDALFKKFDEDTIEPYFPLKRFGRYWFQVGTQRGEEREFYMFDSAQARNAFRDEMVANMAKTGDTRGIDAGQNLKDFVSKNIRDLRTLDELEQIIDDATAGDVASLKEVIKDNMQQLYYLTLPNKSVRKMFINRKQVSGASQDMLRAFVDSSFHMAYQQSRFKYARRMFDQLDAAEQLRKSKPTEMLREKTIDEDYIAELGRRLEYVMNPTDTGTIPSILSNVSFLWYLTAPASALVNMLGVPAIGFPVLAARFGSTKAAAALLSYGKRFMTAGFKDANGEWSMPSIGMTKLDPREKAAYDIFVSSGLIDITQSHDLAGVAEAPSNLYTGRMNMIMKAFSAMFHHAERFNREVVAMSAYRMAYDVAIKAGQPPHIAFNKAVDQAKDLTYRSMFDYSTLNKPRYLQNAYAKVILQFKQFPQQMTYLLSRSAYEWMNNLSPDQIETIRENIQRERIRYGQTPLSGAELDAAVAEQVRMIKKEGRDRLLGTLGMTFLFAGATGMPLFSVGASVIEAVHAAFSDEDEPPLDFENWFKNWMAQTFGDFWGDSISRGLVTQTTGMNVADRMSLNDLWFRDSRKSQDEVTAFQNMIINLLGPTAALGVSGAEAVKLFNDGHYYRGAERIMPAVFKQPMVGARYATEGVLTQKGDELISQEEMSTKDALSQSLGFAPEKVAQRQKANIEKKAMEQDVINKRQDLLNSFFMGVDTSNDDLLDRTLDKIARFNRMYPSYTITANTLSRSVKTRYKARALAEVSGGIPINKNLMAELEAMGYYGQ